MTTTLRTGSKGPDVKKLQEILNTTLRLNPALKIDGDFGRATNEAVKRFQAENGLGIDGIVGPKTLKALGYNEGNKNFGIKKPSPSPINPVIIMNSNWMKIATKEIGQKEVVGKGSNPRIIKYHASTTLKAKSDEIPWCSSFVNWVIKEAGMQGTNSAAAASWLTWGEKSSAKTGAITVIRNANAANSSLTSSGNHVGFLIQETATHYELLGGNQSNRVRTTYYPKSSWTLRGYRWPKKSEVSV
ncbi:MAG TPA: TIGR02594 family protein [Cellvibrio sp.]|nr:TIGR02594 family protein [Cellvibrio sp.]